MRRYIDFDGVVVDTSPLLFKEWQQMKYSTLTEEDKIEYVKKQNWEVILNNSPIINDSMYILKQLNTCENAILTTVHSLENEGVSKVKYLRKNGVLLPIIVVPYLVDKIQIVNPQNNILIDDRIYNLDVWNNAMGHAIFFNKDNLDIDEWNVKNFDYPKISTLNDLDKIKIKRK